MACANNAKKEHQGQEQMNGDGTQKNLLASREIPEEMTEESGEDYVGENDVLEEIEEVADDLEPMSDADDEEGEDLTPEQRQQLDEVSQAFLSDDSIQGFFEHKEPVYAIAAANQRLNTEPPTCLLVISGGGDDQSTVWDAITGETRLILPKHSDSVSSVCISYDGKYAASGGMDGMVHVANLIENTVFGTFEGPNEVSFLKFHPKGNVLLAGSEDGTIWMWSLPSGKCMQVFSGHVQSVTSGIFTPDGKKIISGSIDGMVIIWDPKISEPLVKVNPIDYVSSGDKGVTALAANSDSSTILVGYENGRIRHIHIGTGKVLSSFDSHTDSVESLDFCSVFHIALSASTDGTICIWDLNTFRVRHILKHEDAVTKAVFGIGSTHVFSSSADRTLRRWESRTGECLQVWKGHQEAILDFSVYSTSSSFGRIISCSDDGTCLVFSLAT